MATKEATLVTRDRVRGDRPAHVHKCNEGHSGEHTWTCNSPYCVEINAECPDHGGLEPVPIGYEPWKGR